MGAIFSLLGGGLMRLLPEVFKLFSDKQDKSHEVTMTQLQLEIDKARAAQQLSTTQAQAAVAQATGEMQAYVEAVKAQAVMTGVKFIDGLSQSVRPVVTYWWMGLLTEVKIVAMLNGMPIWGEYDWDVLSMILGFWFVERAIKHNAER
jgi:hypothetical protein